MSSRHAGRLVWHLRLSAFHRNYITQVPTNNLFYPLGGETRGCLSCCVLIPMYLAAVIGGDTILHGFIVVSLNDGVIPHELILCRTSKTGILRTSLELVR